MTADRAVSAIAATKMSLEMTSSFFCSSPDLFLLSASPTRPRTGAVATRFEMFLHATAMLLMITARSASTWPLCSCLNSHIESVSFPTRLDPGAADGAEEARAAQRDRRTPRAAREGTAGARAGAREASAAEQDIFERAPGRWFGRREGEWRARGRGRRSPRGSPRARDLAVITYPDISIRDDARARGVPIASLAPRRRRPSDPARARREPPPYSTFRWPPPPRPRSPSAPPRRVASSLPPRRAARLARLRASPAARRNRAPRAPPRERRPPGPPPPRAWARR